MKNSKLGIVLAAGALLTFALIAVFSFYNGASVIVDGESVTGVSGAGYAVGGAMIGVLAALFALVVVSLVVTGVSIFVMAVLALVFFVVVVALSPLLLPLLFVTGGFWFFSRKKTASAA